MPVILPQNQRNPIADAMMGAVSAIKDVHDKAQARQQQIQDELNKQMMDYMYFQQKAQYTANLNSEMQKQKEDQQQALQTQQRDIQGQFYAELDRVPFNTNANNYVQSLAPIYQKYRTQVPRVALETYVKNRFENLNSQKTAEKPSDKALTDKDIVGMRNQIDTSARQQVKLEMSTMFKKPGQEEIVAKLLRGEPLNSEEIPQAQDMMIYYNTRLPQITMGHLAGLSPTTAAKLYPEFFQTTKPMSGKAKSQTQNTSKQKQSYPRVTSTKFLGNEVYLKLEDGTWTTKTAYDLAYPE